MPRCGSRDWLPVKRGAPDILASLGPASLRIERPRCVWYHLDDSCSRLIRPRRSSPRWAIRRGSARERGWPPDQRI